MKRLNWSSVFTFPGEEIQSLLFLLFVFLTLILISIPSKASTAASISTPVKIGEIESENQKIRAEIALSRSEAIWGFDFLASGEIVFAEKSGALFRWQPDSPRQPTRIQGVFPSKQVGQGGLLDVAVLPGTEKIFWTFTHADEKGLLTTALASGELKENQILGARILDKAQPANKNSIHFGSRIVFPDSKSLIYSVGDRNERHQAQNPRSDLGKLIRMNIDGTNKKHYSLGHRNPQGLYWLASKSQLWSSEFGPRGGDELNLIQEGKNYGWPIITYGREYWGPKIGEGSAKAGLEQPRVQWTPSISPSALLIYEGDLFPRWKGDFFLACLATEQLLRVRVPAESPELNSAPVKPLQEESLLKGKMGRFRSLRVDSKGALWISTDEGKLIRLISSGS